MRTDIVLAAFFAGSQIAAASWPHNFAMAAMTNDGTRYSRHRRWGWGHGSHGHGHGRSQVRQGNSGGFIGAEPEGHGKQGNSDGFIGMHQRHGSPQGGSPQGGGGGETTTVTITVTATNSFMSSSTARAPSQIPSGTRSSSANVPSSSSQPGSGRGHGKRPPSGGSGGGGSGGGSSGGSADGSFQEQTLHFHNVHRANHSASPLTWDASLASIANQIAQSCVFQHDTAAGGGGYGQNIAAGSPPSDIGKVVGNEFYNGEVNFFDGLYGQANPSMANFEKWGHFSQVVWKNTQSVGCATVQCPGGVGMTSGNVQPFFTVCNYKPPGNVAGQYAKNVGQSLGEPSVVA